MAKLELTLDYSEARGFNLGIARDVGLDAAVAFQQLVFWQQRKGAGLWFYKPYSEMMDELPLSEKELRKSYETLKTKGYIETKLQKVNGTPTLHFRICQKVRMESAKKEESLESAKRSETINNKIPIKNNPMSEAEAPDLRTATDVRKIYRLYLTRFKCPDYEHSSTEQRTLLLEKAEKRYKLTPPRREAIERRLKDAGFNMLAAAIVGYSRDAWYQGENDRNWTADLQKFICRSYEKVEEGANKYEQQKAGSKTDDPWA